MNLPAKPFSDETESANFKYFFCDCCKKNNGCQIAESIEKGDKFPSEKIRELYGKDKRRLFWHCCIDFDDATDHNRNVIIADALKEAGEP